MTGGQLSIHKKYLKDKDKFRNARHKYYLEHKEHIFEYKEKRTKKMTMRYLQNLRQVYDDPESLIFGELESKSAVKNEGGKKK